MQDHGAALMTESQTHVLPLSLLRAGQRGTINGVLGPSDWVQRLREMGLRDGAEVRMVRQGSPCMIRLGSQTLCFRADESTRVLVAVG
jgi:ferrous iron transport protein A